MSYYFYIRSTRTGDLFQKLFLKIGNVRLHVFLSVCPTDIEHAVLNLLPNETMLLGMLKKILTVYF